MYFFHVFLVSLWLSPLNVFFDEIYPLFFLIFHDFYDKVQGQNIETMQKYTFSCVWKRENEWINNLALKMRVFLEASAKKLVVFKINIMCGKDKTKNILLIMQIRKMIYYNICIFYPMICL